MLPWTPGRGKQERALSVPSYSKSAQFLARLRQLRLTNRSASDRTKHLVEKVKHRGPGAAVRRLVVGEAGSAKPTDVRVGEAVAGAAVQIHPPVDLRGRHLLLDCDALLLRDDRI